MSLPTPEFQIQFLENIQRLLAEGRFTASYEYALLLGRDCTWIDMGEGADDGLAASRLGAWIARIDRASGLAMVHVVIEGYLTQRKLSDALQQIVRDAWAGDEIAIPNSRRRWDMAYRDNETVVVVEYDGDEHYRNSIRIKVDREKDALAKAAGYAVIRMPYWVQLDTETLRYYFGLEASIEQDFPHGFITTKLFPASFCEMGIQRFERELNDLPNWIRREVLDSLRDRASEHGIEFVLPTPLRQLI